MIIAKWHVSKSNADLSFAYYLAKSDTSPYAYRATITRRRRDSAWGVYCTRFVPTKRFGFSDDEQAAGGWMWHKTLTGALATLSNEYHNYMRNLRVC